MDVRIACLGVVALCWGGVALAQNVKVNEELARVFASDDVLDFRFSPDGARVVYTARRTQISSQVELFSRPVDASSPSLRLNGALAPGGTVHGEFSEPGFLLAGSGRVVSSSRIQVRASRCSASTRPKRARSSRTPPRTPSTARSTSCPSTAARPRSGSAGA